MSNPTREQIEAAHYATEQLVLLATAIRDSPAVKDYREMILKALPPKPRPTMADVEWDDKKHYLAEAENEGWGKVLMLGMDHEHRGVTILVKTGNVVYLPCAKPQSLTPTGKRYTLTEVQE